MKPHYSFLINRTQTFLIFLQISAFFISLICRFVRYETPLFSVYYLRLTPTKNVEIFRLPFCSTKNLNNGRVNLQSFGKHPKYSTQEEIMEQYGNGGAKVLKLWKVKKHKLYNTWKYNNPTQDWKRLRDSEFCVGIEPSQHRFVDARNLEILETP